MSDADCEQQLDAAAYLLGALQPEEAERFREHLQGCASCRRELDELQATVHALPRTAKPARASDALVGRIMAQVRSEAELLHAAGPQADRVPARTAWWGTRRLAAIAATATIAGAAVVGAVLISSGSSTGERVTQARVAESAPGGHAELRQNGVRAELVVANIPQPALGKIYQVWIARAHGAPQPTDALFSVSTDGSASVDVPGDLQHVQRLMVTAEPTGGSRHPTSPPIITATLKPS
jgi:anti-sigma-K factor RskA